MATDENEELSWPIAEGCVEECDVVVCASRARWNQFVTLGSGDEAILALCAWHSFELHKVDRYPHRDALDPVFARHYRCLTCGGPVQRGDAWVSEDDGQLVPATYYECTAGCRPAWDKEVMWSAACDRLLAAWEAEQPPEEEE